MEGIDVLLLVLFCSGSTHAPRGQCGRQRTAFAGELPHFPSRGFQRSQIAGLSSKHLHLLSHLGGPGKTFRHPDGVSVVAVMVVGFIIL